MSSLLRPADLAQLQHELHKCDSATLSLLRPIIPLKSVQNLLFTFLRDTSKTFQQHLDDPSIRQVLRNIGDQNPIANNGSDAIDRCFEENVKMLQEELGQTGPMLQCPPQEPVDAANKDSTIHPYLRDAEKYRDLGKNKFEKGEMYGAMNAYKKAIDSLQGYQKDENWGIVVDVVDWEDEKLKELYVVLCCNVSICAIKLQDLSSLREYSSKALRVDNRCAKALYAKAKLFLVEHMYEEAAQIMDEALQYHPDNDHLRKFRQEIKEEEFRFHDRQAAAEAENARIAEEIREKQTAQSSEMMDKKDSVRSKKHTTIALPRLTNGDHAASELHKYYTRTHDELLIEIVPLYNPADGESPLFSCTIADGTNKIVLADDIRAGSKKLAKQEACKYAIAKLWEIKANEGSLTDDQMVEYTAYKLETTCVISKSEESADDKKPNAQIASDREVEEDIACCESDTEGKVMENSSMTKENTAEPLLKSMYLSHVETQLTSLVLLNQLKAQRKIFFEFEIVCFESQPPQFECSMTLNNSHTVTAQAQSKKKARAEAADKLVQVAVEKNIFLLPNDYQGRWRAFQATDSFDSAMELY